MSTRTYERRAILGTFGEFARNGLGVPVVVMAVIAMMGPAAAGVPARRILPFNISLSLIILLAVIYVRRALEFATFPTVAAGSHAAQGWGSMSHRRALC